MADMQELIARLEAAEVGSRELDVEVWKTFSADRIDRELSLVRGTWPRGASEDEKNARRVGFLLSNAPRFTTSLDAALALAERVVGDREWMVEGKDRPLGRVHRACLGIVGPVYASTPALALCCAILKAVHLAILKAKEQGEGG